MYRTGLKISFRQTILLRNYQISNDKSFRTAQIPPTFKQTPFLQFQLLLKTETCYVKRNYLFNIHARAYRYADRGHSLWNHGLYLLIVFKYKVVLGFIRQRLLASPFTRSFKHRTIAKDSLIKTRMQPRPRQFRIRLRESPQVQEFLLTCVYFGESDAAAEELFSIIVKLPRNARFESTGRVCLCWPIYRTENDYPSPSRMRGVYGRSN